MRTDEVVTSIVEARTLLLLGWVEVLTDGSQTTGGILNG
jgi:hypothetical protein